MRETNPAPHPASRSEGTSVRSASDIPGADGPGGDGAAGRAWSWEDAVALLGCVAVAGWLRVDGLSRGLSSDELANVMPIGWWEIATDPEAGVNPPLLRLLMNVPFHDATTPILGRWWSLGWSLLAVGLAYAVGRRAGGGRLGAGAFAALALAVHPVAITYATIYRIYAWWTGMMLLHLWVLMRALDTPYRDRRPWLAATIATAIVLPWIHYFSVPILLGLGAALLLGMPGRRHWVGLYVPSALAITPMVPFVLYQPARRVVQSEPVADTISKIVALGLTPPKALANPVGKAWRAVTDLPFHWPDWMFGAMVLIVAGHLLAWPWLSRGRRVLTAGALTVGLATAALAQVQYVRDPTIQMMLVFLAPLLGALPAAARWWPVRVVGWGLLGWWMADQLEDRLAFEQERARDRDMVPAFVEARDVLEGIRDGRRIRIHPGYLVPSVYFYLAGEHFRRAPWSAACEDLGPCFEHEGVVFAGIDLVEDGSRYDAVIVSFDPYLPEGFADNCTVVQTPLQAAVFDCRGDPPTSAGAAQGEGAGEESVDVPPSGGAVEPAPGRPVTDPMQGADGATSGMD